MAEATEEVMDVMEGAERDRGRKFVSERGGFEIWDSPPITTPVPSDKVKVDQVADGFEYGALAEKFGEAPVRQKIGEMVKAFSEGVSTTVLFSQPPL